VDRDDLAWAPERDGAPALCGADIEDELDANVALDLHGGRLVKLVLVGPIPARSVVRVAADALERRVVCPSRGDEGTYGEERHERMRRERAMVPRHEQRPKGVASRAHPHDVLVAPGRAVDDDALLPVAATLENLERMAHIVRIERHHRVRVHRQVDLALDAIPPRMNREPVRHSLLGRSEHDRLAPHAFVHVREPLARRVLEPIRTRRESVLRRERRERGRQLDG
jgi:hypothetical protein